MTRTLYDFVCKQCSKPFTYVRRKKTFCSSQCMAEFYRGLRGEKSPSFKHGHASYEDSPEYVAWLAMKQRCFYTKHRSYSEYGGRGITVSPEWLGEGGFQRFLAHIGPKATPEHSLDRIENQGNYEPGNIRWATREEQNNNQRVKRTSGLCRRGHPLTQENIIVEGKGRRCRLCRKTSRNNRR